MSINSSSSHPFAVLSTNVHICYNSINGFLIFSAFTITNILFLLPLSALVLYVGLQRLRRRQATNHTDHFTYHMVAMEIFCLIGSVFYCIGIYMRNWELTISGFFCFSVIVPGRAIFHCLTCMERYLVVVHPITYLRLRKSGGVRIRNISIGCVWLLCAGWMGVSYACLPDFMVIPSYILSSLSVLVSTFCSVSVLRVLRRQSPGERAEGRERVDQSKRRIFHTILAIMGVLLLGLSAFMVCMVYNVTKSAIGDVCLVLSITFWFCLPSSLVLPLLFLHRARKQG